MGRQRAGDHLSATDDRDVDTSNDVEGGQRDDQARYPGEGDDGAVDHAACHTDPDAGEKDHWDGDPVHLPEEVGRNVSREAQHRADREVHLPAHHHHRLAERQQGEDRGIQQDELDVLLSQEPGLKACGHGNEDDQDGDDPVLPEPEDQVDQPLRAFGWLRQGSVQVRDQVAGGRSLPCGRRHDVFLGDLTVGELGDEPSLPHDKGPVTHPQDLRELRRDHQHRDRFLGRERL